MSMDALESTTNSRSSGLFEVGAGIYLCFNRSMESISVRILEPVNMFRQVPCYSAGASFLVQGFPHVTSPNVGAQGLRS